MARPDVLHDYLGELDDLEGGYGFFEPGAVMHLPCFVLQGVVLMPGGTLPLNALDAATVEAVKQIVAAPPPATRMMAVVQGGPARPPAIGCTAEVRKMAHEADGMVRVVAKGRQRAKVELLVPLQGRALLDAMVVPAEVTVLEEDPVQRVPRSVLRSEAWAPPWVAKLHDPFHLASCARAEACLSMPEAADAPGGPAQLSYWLAERLPVSATVRQELLEAPTAAERLRRERRVLGSYCVALCRRCERQIASVHDSLVGSSVLGGGLFVNPHGHVHDMVTLKRVNQGAVYLQGAPSTEFSWFPGYAWTITHCSTCFQHLGWRFTAAEPGLAPQQFWGISRGALATADPHATQGPEGSDDGHAAANLPPADHELVRLAWGLVPVTDEDDDEEGDGGGSDDDEGGSSEEGESEYETESGSGLLEAESESAGPGSGAGSAGPGSGSEYETLSGGEAGEDQGSEEGAEVDP